jgi:hypothetical protein
LATGTGVSGSGTTSLTITGSLAQVNSDLATLADTEASAGADTIDLAATDSLGNSATSQSISVSTNGLPTITAPASKVVTLSQSTAISGVSVAESGHTEFETFTVTLGDTTGLLAATGTGVSGSGTTSLTITGSLTQVNADLATLTDTKASAGADTIHVGVTDSMGNSAAAKTIAITTATHSVLLPLATLFSQITASSLTTSAAASGALILDGSITGAATTAAAPRALHHA